MEIFFSYNMLVQWMYYLTTSDTSWPANTYHSGCPSYPDGCWTSEYPPPANACYSIASPPKKLMTQRAVSHYYIYHDTHARIGKQKTKNSNITLIYRFLSVGQKVMTLSHKLLKKFLMLSRIIMVIILPPIRHINHLGVIKNSQII